MLKKRKNKNHLCTLNGITISHPEDEVCNNHTLRRLYGLLSNQMTYCNGISSANADERQNGHA
jgi:hypothetical protein